MIGSTFKIDGFFKVAASPFQECLTSILSLAQCLKMYSREIFSSLLSFRQIPARHLVGHQGTAAYTAMTTRRRVMNDTRQDCPRNAGQKYVSSLLTRLHVHVYEAQKKPEQGQKVEDTQQVHNVQSQGQSYPNAIVLHQKT